MRNTSIGRFCLAIPQVYCLKRYYWVVRTVMFLAMLSYCVEIGMTCLFGKTQDSFDLGGLVNNAD